MRTVILTIDMSKDNSVAALTRALTKCNEAARSASQGTYGGNSAIRVEEAYRGNPLREVALVEEVLSDGSKVYNVAVTL